MKIRTLLFLSFMFLSIVSSFAQLAVNENLKKIERKAFKFMSNDQFENARPLFEKLLNNQAANEEYLLNMGICEYQLNDDKNVASEYFLKIAENYRSSKKMTDFTPTALFYLTKCYENLYLFDEAQQCISELETLNLQKEQKQILQNERNYVTVANEMFQNPVPMITTRDAVINTEYDDHTPIPTANGDKIFFTSKRPGGQSDVKDEKGKYFEDIWVYDKNSQTKAPANIGAPVNTEFHDATCGLSHDGKILFIYKASKKVAGDIYMSKFDNATWSSPVKLGKNINTKYTEKHATLSADGKTLYFTSDRSKGKGGRDIWISKIQADGSWGKAENFVLNTSGDEESPYIMADGKTMFFSSTGYPGMGGYDIFKTTLGDDGTWSKPENIGFPVNTVEDDVFYFPIGNGNKAYYTQRNSTNSDIYVAYLYDETEGDIMVSGIIKDNNYFVQNEIPVRVSGDTIVLNKGKIIKKKTNFIVARDSVVMQYLSRTNDPQSQVYHVPPKSGIQSQDVLSEHMSETYQPFTEKGDYSVIVKSKKDVKMVYNAPNCIFDTKDINSSNTKSKIIYNPILVKIEKGKTIKKKCMAYDNSSALNEFAKSELDLVAECIKTNPDLYVNISTEDYMTAGDELSGKRKNAAIDYLKGKGVPSEKVYVDLSSDNIAKDSVQYTIYDELTLQKAKEDKENRKKVTPPSEQWVTIHYNHYLFGFNKSKLESEKAQGLDSIIIFLKNNPETQIRIIGYADAVGRDEYNKNLSAERALQLKNYFVKQGVSANQLVSDGYGEENPIALNTKKDGSWYKESQKFNRRAEFIVEKQGSVKLKFEVLDIPSQYKDSGYQLNYLK